MPGSRPPLVDITIKTRHPGKWLFVDTETGQVWAWVDGSFKRHREPVHFNTNQEEESA